MNCLNCGKDWPVDSEQGVAMEIYAMCIVCLVKKFVDWDSKKVMKLARQMREEKSYPVGGASSLSGTKKREANKRADEPEETKKTMTMEIDDEGITTFLS